MVSDGRPRPKELHIDPLPTPPPPTPPRPSDACSPRAVDKFTCGLATAAAFGGAPRLLLANAATSRGVSTALPLLLPLSGFEVARARGLGISMRSNSVHLSLSETAGDADTATGAATAFLGSFDVSEGGGREGDEASVDSVKVVVSSRGGPGGAFPALTETGGDGRLVRAVCGLARSAPPLFVIDVDAWVAVGSVGAPRARTKMFSFGATAGGEGSGILDANNVECCCCLGGEEVSTSFRIVPEETLALP